MAFALSKSKLEGRMLVEIPTSPKENGNRGEEQAAGGDGETLVAPQGGQQGPTAAPLHPRLTPVAG